jgi:fused signal recognition particle receptor
MLANEIYIVLALLVLGAIAFVAFRGRAKALPPAEQPKELGAARGEARPKREAVEAPERRPALAEPEPSERAEADRDREVPREVLAEQPAAEAGAAAPGEPSPTTGEAATDLEARTPSVAPAAEPGVASPAAAAAPEPAAAPAERPARKPFFTPPPLPGQPRLQVPTPAPVPAEAAPRLAVPLPVDKPKLATSPDAAELARREQERERYRQGLAKTRSGFVAKLARLFKSRPKVTAELRDRIEEVLLTADIGTTTAEKLQAKVTKVLDSKEVADPDAVWSVIRQAMLELLEIDVPAPDYAPKPGPYVLLMIGVNGVGKTTTLGKLAAQHRRAGRKVLLVAGDTFRAAATEQLDVWARRVGCEIHMGADKADPSSVIFEGITRGRREGYDVVLCDTAGRLHTRKELMDELAKVGRAAAKAIGKGLPEGQAAAITGAHDTFLVLDATIGQNALAQAQLFKETMGFSGLVITKLDGTAKGGVVLGVCDELGVPIRYVGIGEGIDDLRAFDAQDFVDALLADRDRAGEDARAPEPG